MPWLSSKFVALGRALLPARQEQADSSQDDPVLPSLPRQKPDTDDATEVAIEATREESQEQADSSQDDPVLPSLPRQKPDTDDATEVAIEAIREEIRREATRRARARRSSVGIGSPMRNN